MKSRIIWILGEVVAPTWMHWEGWGDSTALRERLELCRGGQVGFWEMFCLQKVLGTAQVPFGHGPEAARASGVFEQHSRDARGGILGCLCSWTP